MKKLLITMICCFILIGVKAQTQTLNTNYWCIQNISTLTDTNGNSYTNISLYTNQICIDSFSANYYAINAIICGSNVINLPTYWNNLNMLQCPDSTINFKLDTVINPSLISAISLMVGVGACGIWWQDTALITNFCGNNYGANGLANIAAKTGIIVYPNPANNNITIQSANSDFKIGSKIQLVNSIGQTVYENKVVDANKNRILINCTSFAKGTYVVIVNQKAVQKFILK